MSYNIEESVTKGPFYFVHYYRVYQYHNVLYCRIMTRRNKNASLYLDRRCESYATYRSCVQPLAVSYTHLDVYKRQSHYHLSHNIVYPSVWTVRVENGRMELLTSCEYRRCSDLKLSLIPI